MGDKKDDLVPIDFLKPNNSVNENDKMKILLRDKEVNKWNVLCKDKTSLLQFLKDNIHKNA